jgi:hypothetical protein
MALLSLGGTEAMIMEQTACNCLEKTFRDLSEAMEHGTGVSLQRLALEQCEAMKSQGVELSIRAAYWKLVDRIAMAFE